MARILLVDDGLSDRRVDRNRSWADALAATGILDLGYDAQDLEEMRDLIEDFVAPDQDNVRWKLVKLKNKRIRDAGRALLDARCRPTSLIEYLDFAKKNPDALFQDAIFSVGTRIVGDVHKGSVKIPYLGHVDLSSAGLGTPRCMRWVLHKNDYARVSITVLGIVLRRRI